MHAIIQLGGAIKFHSPCNQVITLKQSLYDYFSRDTKYNTTLLCMIVQWHIILRGVLLFRKVRNC